MGSLKNTAVGAFNAVMAPYDRLSLKVYDYLARQGQDTVNGIWHEHPSLPADRKVIANAAVLYGSYTMLRASSLTEVAIGAAFVAGGFGAFCTAGQKLRVDTDRVARLAKFNR